MGCYTALIALLFILHTVNGQTTTATPPSSTTDPPLSSAAPQSSGTPAPQTSSTDPLSSSTATSSSTTSPSDTTASSVGITPSSIDVTFSGYSTTNPVPLVASFSRKCSSHPPLCCLGLNNSCFRGCFCDVACLQLNDCCPDFQTTCVTGVQNGTSLSATVSPVSNATNATNATNSTSTSFPVFSFPDIQTVIGSLKISILAPSNSTDASLEVSIQKAALQLQVYLKATYSEISSFRIIKLKKTGKT